jgi:hypothetical protein
MNDIVTQPFTTVNCAGMFSGNLPDLSRKRYKIGILVANRCIGLRTVSEVLGCVRVGAWRSLVAHLLWEQRVAGSNPAAPTTKITRARGGAPGTRHVSYLWFRMHFPSVANVRAVAIRAISCLSTPKGRSSGVDLQYDLSSGRAQAAGDKSLFIKGRP